MRILGWVALVAAAIMTAQPAAASIWIDSTMGELKAEDKVAVANPQPVQLLIEFQTNGATNAKAIKEVTPMITEEVKATGVVGSTSETPVPSGARLSILVNDIPDKDAAKKGFTAGLTLGLAGVVAGDSYEIMISYVPASGAPPITRNLKHRLVMKFGNKTLPPNLVQVKSIKIGIRTLIRQFVSHGLNAIAKDPAFPGATVAAAAAPAATPPQSEPAGATTAAAGTS